MSVKICLNMIMKDEAHLGTRPFENLKGLYESAVILDTGSTDDTVKICREYMKQNEIPGEIIEGTWKGFGKSRSEAIEHAERWVSKQKGRYTWYFLFADYDDLLLAGTKDKKSDERPIIKRNELTLDKYNIDIYGGNIVYDRVLMVKYNPEKRWIFVMPVHEFITPREDGMTYSQGKLKNIFLDSRREGARSKNPRKYLDDALAFEEEMKLMKPSDKYYDRCLYYRSQSYRDYGWLEMAEKCYLERAYGCEVTDEYHYLALVEAARIRINRLKWMKEAEYLLALRDINVDDKTKLSVRGLICDPMTVKLLTDAYERRPFRADGTVLLTEHYRCSKQYNMAVAIGMHCLSYPAHHDMIFVDVPAKEYKLFDSVAVSLSYVGKNIEAKKLFEQILISKSAPLDLKERTKKNLDFILERLKPKKVEPNAEVKEVVKVKGRGRGKK